MPALTAGTKTWGSDKVDDLWHAAINSEGQFFSAKNSSELADALTSALTTTTQSELREAGVATASSVLEDGNRKYIPFYKSGTWTGDIRAFELDANGRCSQTIQWKRKRQDNDKYAYTLRFRNSAGTARCELDPWLRN